MTWLLFSILLAFWFKTEIPRFAERINKQVYCELSSLIPIKLSESEFLATSTLSPIKSNWTNLFFILFPLIMWLSSSPIIGLIFILLCFLSLLDICYYLTDIRYIALLFLLVLWKSLTYFHNETLLFSCLFCLLITLFSQFVFKKESFGYGDMLLLCALAPLFEPDKMLLLVLISSLFGIFFYWLYWIFHKQKLEKLPFIPFISMAMGIVYFT